MAEGKTYDYTILPESEDGDISPPLHESHDRPHLKMWPLRTLAPYLATSILLNALLIALNLYQNLHHTIPTKSHYKMPNGQRISPYGMCPLTNSSLSHLTRKFKASLAYDTPYRFEYHNDYWSTNETLADHLWDSISTDELVVALDESYQITHGLLPSNPFPWDQSKGLYYIKSMHLLHCLVSGILLP